MEGVSRNILRADRVKTLREHIKTNGAKLLPFFKCTGLYFVFFISTEQPSCGSLILKCLPIVSLAAFVCLQGISWHERHAFSRRILAGLIFSCIGDAFLIWHHYFAFGMSSFAIAQTFYISAFGFDWEHASWLIGASIYGFNGLVLFFLIPNLKNHVLHLRIGAPIYSLLLTTMVWRAVVRSRNDSLKSRTWSKVCSLIGGLAFATSDTLLAIHDFIVKIPCAQALIMSTYYFAQLCIALSVVPDWPGELSSTPTPTSLSTQNSSRAQLSHDKKSENPRPENLEDEHK